MEAQTPERNIDMAVFIGRFQPYHLGHDHVVTEALKRADYLTVVIGSSGSASTLRNPFSFEQRVEMIRGALPSEVRDRVFFRGIADVDNDETWVALVQDAVWSALQEVADLYSVVFPQVALFGYAKDHTSYYLKMFPQWMSIGVLPQHVLSSTEIRARFFGRGGTSGSDLGWPIWAQARMKFSTYAFLAEFVRTDAYDAIVLDLMAIEKFQRDLVTFRDGDCAFRHPPVFVTVDAVVIQSGHVLLIQRSTRPGAGLNALPGGFVDADETIADAWIRELLEETGLKVPEQLLRASMVATEVFDKPHRDPRGRMITHAFLVNLPPGPLPSIEAGSDATSATWVPLSDLRRETFYADHMNIIERMMSRIGPSAWPVKTTRQRLSTGEV